jgi:hypothetical protein
LAHVFAIMEPALLTKRLEKAKNAANHHRNL